MHDPIAHVALGLAVILVAAKVGGHVAARLGQAAVLGELIVGVLLGAAPVTARLAQEPGIDVVARIGALVLLFEVGLDLTVRDVLAVGRPAVVTGVLGTIASFAFGFLAALLLRPGTPGYLHAFIGASITATSVGITARVFKDLGRTRDVEAHVVLGAAVVDDVLGLLVLALVTGSIAAAAAGGDHRLSAGAIALTVVKAVGFLGGATLLGVKLAPAWFAFASRWRATGALLAAGLSMCFALAWAADLLGLAPIVGAFAAGLVLEESHSARFVARGERSLAEIVEPVSTFVVPVFFVVIGMRTDLRVLAHPAALALAAVLTLAAVLGKSACALGAPRGSRRVAVAVGMMPRGEVTLVYASLGGSLEVNGAPLLDGAAYSALVLVIVATTLLTPAALKASLARRPAPPSPPARSEAA